MLCFSIISDLELRKFSGKSERLPEKLIHIIDYDYPSYKKFRGNTIVCRFIQDISFHTQMKDGANTSSIWFFF